MIHALFLFAIHLTSQAYYEDDWWDPCRDYFLRIMPSVSPTLTRSPNAKPTVSPTKGMFFLSLFICHISKYIELDSIHSHRIWNSFLVLGPTSKPTVSPTDAPTTHPTDCKC
jgi:hypothetical protein